MTDLQQLALGALALLAFALLVAWPVAEWVRR